ncbi:MAG: methylated-DNA--[Bacteroidales bacterium]|nr:methylated-DNA--[protein]-cysteine S-methyltransferase [Bacteroidales bacterium]
MNKDKQWIITRVDGLVASVSMDWSGAERVFAQLSRLSPARYSSAESVKISTSELFELAANLTWDDLLLFGTPFQKEVWKAVFDITHPAPQAVGLLSYTELAESLGKGPGVRAVAHALALNPVPVIIPCHLVIPKESVARLQEVVEENGLFRWETLYMVDRYIDYGEYAFGTAVKRELIQLHLNR